MTQFEMAQTLQSVSGMFECVFRFDYGMKAVMIDRFAAPYWGGPQYSKVLFDMYEGTSGEDVLDEPTQKRLAFILSSVDSVVALLNSGAYSGIDPIEFCKQTLGGDGT